MAKPIRIGLAFTFNFAYYRGVARGIRLYAETRPHWLFTSIIPEEQPLQRLGARKPDGLIARVTTEGLARAFASWRRPLVNVASILPGLPFPHVGVDCGPVGRLASDHFLERGLRHFGFVGHPHWVFSTQREQGFRQAVEAAGYHVVSYHHETGIRSFDPFGRHWRLDLDRRVHHWLRGLPKPVGILAADDLCGVQLTEACREAGLRVPEDVALLGVNNDDLLCELARPPLSSVIVPAQQVGREAAALLDRLLAGEKPPREPILLPPTGVVTRRSTEVLAIDDRDVVTAVRFIREHAHVRLRVTDVLGVVGVGRRTLERRCHQALGWGLGEEIQRAHLEQARHLLARTELPIKTVAQQAGFSDFRHMAVVFHQKLGISPTAYRQQMRGGVGEAVRG